MFLICLGIAFTIWLIIASYDHQIKSVDNWCNQRGMTVTDHSIPWYGGPWWHQKGITIWRAETTTKDNQPGLFWFRFGWGMQVQEEIGEGQFVVKEE